MVKTETGEADQLEVLANVIKNYTEKTEGKTYKKVTKEAFDQAIADAQKLVDENLPIPMRSKLQKKPSRLPLMHW